MSSLWTVLGYDRVAEDVAQSLSVSDDIVLVQGPPGAGKSGLASGIGELWESAGGSTVVAVGDSFRSDVAFYPLSFTVGGLRSAWKSLGPAVAGVARAGETLLGTAGIITATVQALAKARPGSRRRRALLLGPQEQDVLVKLERLARHRPALLIADNVHWWDSRSLEFLGRLREPHMAEAFPFLADLRVLAVETPQPYQSVANLDAYKALLGASDTRAFSLERVGRAAFGAVLVALGAPAEPPDDVTETLYRLTGGHLALARRCAMRLAQGEAAAFLTVSDRGDFVERLLTDRIRSLGGVGEQVEALLQVAAVWGLTFRREEVMCAAERGEAETARLLRYCRDEEVLELSNGQAAFVHDRFREYFLGLAMRDRIGVYERMSDCLRRLRPAEYDLRCINALNAERSREAAALGVQAALQLQRDGRSWLDLPATILDAIERGGFTPVVAILGEALEHLHGYRFRQCLNALDTVPRDVPKRLLAEADYLRAMTLMSTRSELERGQARAVLESWGDYGDDEPELWTRLMQLLLYGLFHVREKDRGLALEARLRHFLTARTEYDPAAEDALYTLDRCAGGLYQADVSLVRISEAAKHFGPAPGQTLVRRPLEYYRCLVNETATMISNGRHDEAVKTHRKLEEFVDRYAEGAFPRLDLPRMNALLAEFRLGVVSSTEAAARQREIASGPAVTNDPFYPENALAVYSALAGDYEEALSILARLDGQLSSSRVEPEASMVYLIRANRCIARFCAGLAGEVVTEWGSLAGLVSAISYPSRPIYERRHELLAPLLAGARPPSAAEFDEVLVVNHPHEVGPLWTHYGRAFMLPAIEIWREN